MKQAAEDDTCPENGETTQTAEAAVSQNAPEKEETWTV